MEDLRQTLLYCRVSHPPILLIQFWWVGRPIFHWREQCQVVLRFLAQILTNNKMVCRQFLLQCNEVKVKVFVVGFVGFFSLILSIETTVTLNTNQAAYTFQNALLGVPYTFDIWFSNEYGDSPHLIVNYTLGTRHNKRFSLKLMNYYRLQQFL